MEGLNKKEKKREKLMDTDSSVVVVWERGRGVGGESIKKEMKYSNLIYLFF